MRFLQEPWNKRAIKKANLKEYFSISYVFVYTIANHFFFFFFFFVFTFAPLLLMFFCIHVYRGEIFGQTKLEIYKFRISRKDLYTNKFRNLYISDFSWFLKINDTFRGYVFLINRKLLLIIYILNKWYMTSSIQNRKCHYNKYFFNNCIACSPIVY